MAVNLVRDELDVATLALRILDPHRTVPLILVSIPKNAHTPPPDMRRLQDGVGDGAEIHTIPHQYTVSLSKRLTQRGAYNGAARVYPPGIDDGFDSRLSMLRLPTAYATPQEFAAVLVEDARAQAARQAARAPGPAPANSAGQDPAPTPRTGGAAPRSKPTPATGKSGWTVVSEVQVARALAAHLFSPGRTRPAVVITIASGHDTPYVNVAAVHTAVAGLADVFLMGTGAPSLAFSDAMPDQTQVFGGASRVYPVGTAWVDDLSLSPLRFCYHPSDGAAVGEALISDAMRMSRVSAPTTVQTRTVTGEVSAVVNDRAIVRLHGGGVASIWPELTIDKVVAERLFRVGMTVEGTLDESTGRLDVAASVRPWREGVRHYRVGDQVLGTIRSVEPDLCVIELYPDLPVVVDTSDILRISRRLDLRRVMSEDEIVVCLVVACGIEEEDWSLSLLDVDGDGPVIPAPSLLRGGPPWLPAPATVSDRVVARAPVAVIAPGARPPTVPGSVPVARPDTVPASVPMAGPDTVPGSVPVARPETSSVLVRDDERVAALTHERDELVRRLETGKDRAERMDKELRQARSDYRAALAEASQLRDRLGSADEAVRVLDGDAHRFLDPITQLTFEVNLAWARRFPAAEKRARPLAAWTVGPDFLASLDSVRGVDRSKVIDVIVEVLTGVVHELAGRDSHQLRSGQGGDDAFVTRPDGATCWRVSLQHKTPQARRLHYWMLNDGSVELSSIRVHDDMNP